MELPPRYAAWQASVGLPAPLDALSASPWDAVAASLRSTGLLRAHPNR